MRLSVAAGFILLLGACQSIPDRDPAISPENQTLLVLSSPEVLLGRDDAVRPSVRWHSNGWPAGSAETVDQSFGLDGAVLRTGAPGQSFEARQGGPQVVGVSSTRRSARTTYGGAVSRNGNILLEGVDTERRQVVTAEGDGVVKYGTASWVYGEELDVQEAMWWRGDSQGWCITGSTNLAFRRTP